MFTLTLEIVGLYIEKQTSKNMAGDHVQSLIQCQSVEPTDA